MRRPNADRDAEIRRLWSQGVSGRDLVARFGLAKSTISQICAVLPKRRRYGDPEDCSWPHPRRFAPNPKPSRTGARPIARPSPLFATLPAYEPGQKGSKHGRAKLTEATVEQIQALRKSGWSYPRLAREFHVSRSTICGILSGKTWQHLANSPKQQ